MAIIEFKNVYKSFSEKDVLRDFNIAIEEGQFITVLGTSGSGKTTIMKMINGLVSPDKGQVYVHGKDISGEDLIQLRRKIGFAIQGNALFPHLTVYENIAYVPRLLKWNKEKIDQVVKSTLELVNLDIEVINRYPEELSGGQQQRVNIARAYSASPDILLMDEPFGAVDSITRVQLQNDLKEIHKRFKSTIVFITHDISEAMKLGTKVLILDNGQIQQFATPKEIQANPANDFVKLLIASDM